MKLANRLYRKIWKRGWNECWPWLGYIDEHGYGKVWINGTVTTVHSIVYMLYYGKVFKDHKILTCPILKDCCNPEHMGVGNIDDIVDRVLWKKRQKRRKPKRVPKLSEEQIKQIYLSQDKTSELANDYAISMAYVTNIRKGRKHRKITVTLKEEI